MFRGREMSHPERGRALLERLAEDVSELGVIESAPIQDGRNMVMLLAPVREVTTKPGANEAPAEGAEPEATTGPEATTEPEAAAEPAAPKPAKTAKAKPEAAAAAPEPEPEPTST